MLALRLLYVFCGLFTSPHSPVRRHVAHRSTTNYLGRCTGSPLQARPAWNAPSTRPGTIPVDRKSRPRNLVFRPLDICHGLSSSRVRVASVTHDTGEGIPVEEPPTTRRHRQPPSSWLVAHVSSSLRRRLVQVSPRERRNYSPRRAYDAVLWTGSLLAKKFHFEVGPGRRANSNFQRDRRRTIG